MTNNITTVILVGGKGTRIGGDKGLQLLHGKALIDWVLDIISKQSDEVLISANANQDAYATRGCRVVADRISDGAGPLAGLHTSLSVARHNLIACVPCDTPFLPDDLIARLRAALTPTTEAAVAAVEGQRQPAIALYRKDVLPKLDAYLNSGARKVGDWLNTLQVSEVVFEEASAFTNINSLDELMVANNVQP